MANEAHSKKKTTRNEEMDTSTADRGIIPSEVAARMDREESDFKETADEQAGKESLDVTGGATVDQEGLARTRRQERSSTSRSSRTRWRISRRE